MAAQQSAKCPICGHISIQKFWEKACFGKKWSIRNIDCNGCVGLSCCIEVMRTDGKAEFNVIRNNEVKK